MDWIYLAEDMDKVRVFVNGANEPLGSIKWREILD